MINKSNTAWQKATASNSDDCVEVRRHFGAVEVRDTKDRGEGPTLRMAPTEFAAWLADAKSGKFDRPV